MFVYQESLLPQKKRNEELMKRFVMVCLSFINLRKKVRCGGTKHPHGGSWRQCEKISTPKCWNLLDHQLLYH